MSSSELNQSTVLNPVDEVCRERFELSWMMGDKKTIRECLPDSAAARYRPTLEALIAVKMQLQWKAASRARAFSTDVGRNETLLMMPTPVEEYMVEFPEMNVAAVRRQLIRQEFLIRQSVGDHPQPDDYRNRFPEIDIERLLSPEELRGADTLHYVAGESAPKSPGMPDSIDGYELLERLGAGGMGVVYRARQLAADRIVALKLIRAERLRNVSESARAEIVERFRIEAQATARLDHPNVVGVFEVNTSDPARPWFSMQFVQGESLAEHLVGGPVACRQAAEYSRQIAGAVAHAHAGGILHRDLKPQNIFLRADEEHVLVGDFGLAKLDVDDVHRTSHDSILGTPAYMSPEQIRDSSSVREATDIWSVGATLYHLLTGRPPFQAATSVETLRHVLNYEPTSPRLLNPAVDRDLETICLKCLQKNPQHRYASASLLEEDLALYLSGTPITARPVSRIEHVYRWCRRNPVDAAFAGAAVTGVIVALVSLIVGYRTAADALEESNASHLLARQTVHDLFTEVSETVLLEMPGMQPLRQRLHERALSYYRRFVETGHDSPELREETGEVWFRIGRIEKELGRPADAGLAYHQALTIQQQLIREQLTIPRRVALSSTWNAMGSLHIAQGQWSEAADALLRALELREAVVRESPSNAEFRRLHANTIMNLGAVHRNRSEFPDAVNAFKKANRVHRWLLANASLDSDTDRHVRRALGMTLYNAANAAFGIESADISSEVLVPLSEAVDLFRELLHDQPNSYTIRRWLIFCRQLRAEAYPDVEMAAASAREAAAEMQQLAVENPAVPSLVREWVQLQLLSGRLYSECGRNDDALMRFQEVVSVLGQRTDTLYADAPRDLGIVTAEAALAACQLAAPDALQRLTDGKQLLQRTLAQTAEDEDTTQLLKLINAALESSKE
ncbi:MAG: serine/threonine-protein kinase [Fuerstiella sp.]|nr:serine/threonine-protein kinase [Fuerstiella sp.]